MFRDGKVDAPADYNGPREAVGIVSYLEKIAGPASVELKTAKEVWVSLGLHTAHPHKCVLLDTVPQKEILAPASIKQKIAEEVYALSAFTRCRWSTCAGFTCACSGLKSVVSDPQGR